jgi:hypothetical protein
MSAVHQKKFNRSDKFIEKLIRDTGEKGYIKRGRRGCTPTSNR